MILLPLKQKLPGTPTTVSFRRGALSRGGAGIAAGSPGSPASSGATWFSGGRAGGFLSPLGSPPQAEMTSSGVIPWGRYARTIRLVAVV